MRDYLEELLDSLDAPEEDGNVPELARIAVPASAGTDGTETETARALAWSAGGAVKQSGGGEWALETPADAEMRTFERSGGGSSPDVGEFGAEVKRSGGPGDLTADALARMDAVWRGVGGVSGTDTEDLSGIWAGLGSSVLERGLRMGAASVGSAAALERRLAEQAVRVNAPGRSAERVVVEERSGGGMDLDELDRRLERDARRYDGGIFLY